MSEKNEQKSLTDKAKEPGFWRELQDQARLLYFLLRDPDVPVYLKVIPFIPLVYVFWPADLLPDIFPIVGQIDDLTALLIGARIFVHLSPPDIVARYRAALNAGDEAALKKQIVIAGEDDSS